MTPKTKKKSRTTKAAAVPTEWGCTAFVWNDRTIVFRHFPGWSIDKASDSGAMWALRCEMHGSPKLAEEDPRWQIVEGYLRVEQR